MIIPDLNREEMLYGFAFGISMFFWTGWGSIPVGLVCAVLWALGGAENSTPAWRRVGCPTVQSVVLYAVTGQLLVFPAAMAAFGILTLGYGVPSTQPADDGSVLGRFFWKLTGHKQPWTDILTRGTIMLSLISVFVAAMVLG